MSAHRDLRPNPAAVKRAGRLYPGVLLTTDISEVLNSPEIDAVAVVTPVWTHYEIAKAALENGKHVFVEKPFTSTSSQAEELIELAARRNLRSWWTTRSCLAAPCGRFGSWSITGL